jgi:hypothetical protein
MNKKPHPAYEDGWHDAMRAKSRILPTTRHFEIETPPTKKAETPFCRDPFAWVALVVITVFQIVLAVTVYNQKN